MNNLIEYRVYTLKPGKRPAFQQRFEAEIMPMLERFGVEVVRAGPSLHDDVSFHLVRRYASLADREAQLARFYGSEEWLSRHDSEVMAAIDSYSTCVAEE